MSSIPSQSDGGKPTVMRDAGNNPGRKENMENKPKRKTHTSSSVKNRYNAKAYKRFNAAIKPDLYGRIDEYLKQEGISRPEFLLRAIENLKGEQQ